jgi:hypothetical protein
MFAQMRSALGIDKSVDILDHCHSLSESECEAALEKIREIERTAMTSQAPQPGLVTLMEYPLNQVLRWERVRTNSHERFQTPEA